MISKKIQTALNNQVNAELYSAYLYLAMSAYMETQNLPGFASWLVVQGQEEMTHANKIYRFIIERQGTAELLAIKKPPVKWASPLDAFKAAYNHEVKVSKMINDLVDLAIKEKDHASNAMLQWFVNEQVEEEAAADEVVQKLKLVGKSGEGLLRLDEQMGARTFVDETVENSEE